MNFHKSSEFRGVRNNTNSSSHCSKIESFEKLTYIGWMAGILYKKICLKGRFRRHIQPLIRTSKNTTAISTAYCTVGTQTTKRLHLPDVSIISKFNG